MSADILKYIFLIFLRKKALTFHANCLLGEKKAYFLGGNEKNIISLSAIEYAHQVVKLKLKAGC